MEDEEAGRQQPPGKDGAQGPPRRGADRWLPTLSLGLWQARPWALHAETHLTLTANPCGRFSHYVPHGTRIPLQATLSEAMPMQRWCCENPGHLPTTPSPPPYIVLLILDYQALPRSVFVSQSPLGEAHHFQCSDPPLNGLVNHFPSFRYDRLSSVPFVK